MAKSKEKLRAREYRRRGEAITNIAEKLRVSASTVSLWCRDIQLTDDQIKVLSQHSKDPYFGKRLAYITRIQQKTQEKIERFMSQGKIDIGNYTRRDLFISGVCLYWAEGFKKDNLVGIANSDSRMIRLLITWLKECCDVNYSQLKARVGVNQMYSKDVQRIESYWIRETGIPQEQFQKPYIQRVQWKKNYENPLMYHGVLRIRVGRSTDLLRKILGWIDAMSEYK